ncbi:MAG: hypothetical protein F9K44_15125 [Hyphomicrobiaceae bacterium]|nr:MAG: hypothetical protein F9K44_15125 [Hyphomicrobiaceae bacterium]
MIETLELGRLIGTDISETVTWAAFSLTIILLSLAATRAGLFFAPARQQGEAIRTVLAPAAPALSPCELDLTHQVDRLLAIITDCNRLASRAFQRQATAKAELDQADYCMSALYAEHPMLQGMSSRRRPAAPAKLRQSAAQPALRLAA